MGGCQTDPPQLLCKTVSGCDGASLGSSGPGDPVRSYSDQLMTFSGVVGFDIGLLFFR